MGINNLFNIAASGINAQRLAIEVTSENIANVNTSGYSRQRTIFETAPTTLANGFPLGTGVKLAAVQRSYDGLLQQQIMDGNSTYGKDSTLMSGLQQVEPSFNEVMANGLGQSFEDFFNSWHDLSVNPQGIPERQAVLARSQVLVDNFHQLNTSLNNVISSADNSLVGITNDISDKAKNIASLNYQIKITEQLGGNANELRDQRDFLLQELATKVGITATEQADGTVTVTLPLNSTGGGETLVSGNNYALVYTSVNGGTGLNDIRISSVGNPPVQAGGDADVTDTIGGPNDATKAADNSLGEIGGTLLVRDTIVGGADGYLARLDEMANQLATTVNSQHTAGFDLAGVAGGNFFTGTDSATIALNITDADKIAAAGAAGGIGDNVNALAMADIKADSTIAFTVNGTTTTTTFGGYYNSFVSNIGIDVQSARNATQQDESFLKQLNTLRESNSGVSLDEELTNLVKYQRAFEASARLVNSATEMMDTLINLVR
jgi:flagellar hook-associated protein 1 FlgK